jgi:hypothetical protein
MDPAKRRPGCVGLPLPGVQLRVVAEDGSDVVAPNETPGELRFKVAMRCSELIVATSRRCGRAYKLLVQLSL